MSDSQHSEPLYSLISLPYTPVIKNIDEDIIGLFAIDMSIAHNIFIRGLNSIWQNAPLVKPQDEVAFAGYCRTCITVIHAHHHGEETILFPFLDTKLDMSHNIDQHNAFQDGMHAFEGYMTKVYEKQEKYDAEATRKLLKDFGDPLVEHLHAEIPTVSPEKMKVFEEDMEGLNDMMRKFEEHLKAMPGKLTVFPFVLTHHDLNLAPNWPPIPAPIRWFARNIAPWRHPSYWKFSPFTSSGAPQEYTR